jgi:hypothetical protein
LAAAPSRSSPDTAIHDENGATSPKQPDANHHYDYFAENDLPLPCAPPRSRHQRNSTKAACTEKGSDTIKMHSPGREQEDH